MGPLACVCVFRCMRVCTLYFCTYEYRVAMMIARKYEAWRKRADGLKSVTGEYFSQNCAQTVWYKSRSGGCFFLYHLAVYRMTFDGGMGKSYGFYKFFSERINWITAKPPLLPRVWHLKNYSKWTADMMETGTHGPVIQQVRWAFSKTISRKTFFSRLTLKLDSALWVFITTLCGLICECLLVYDVLGRW